MSSMTSWSIRARRGCKGRHNAIEYAAEETIITDAAVRSFRHKVSGTKVMRRPDTFSTSSGANRLSKGWKEPLRDVEYDAKEMTGAGEAVRSFQREVSKAG